MFGITIKTIYCKYTSLKYNYQKQYISIEVKQLNSENLITLFLRLGISNHKLLYLKETKKQFTMSPTRKTIKTIITCLFLSLTLLTCDKDDSPSNNINNNNPDPDPTAFAQNFGNEISRTFLGIVTDINNNPIENVSITIGNSNVSTDSDGVFISPMQMFMSDLPM